MSNPFAVLSVNEDTPSRKKQKQNAPKLTPAERAALKEEKARKKREQEPEISTSFVIVDDDESGFIAVDKKPASKTEKDDGKLSKKEFMQKKNRGELVNRGGNRGNKGGNRGNRQGGNKGGNRQGGNKQGGNKQGGNKQGGNNKTSQWDASKPNTKKETPKQSYQVKKDRKPRNNANQKSEKKGGAGDFNWDDPLDVNYEQKVQEAKDVVPEEKEVEPVELESSEEWFHEEVPEDLTDEARQKFLENVKPDVKRVGLSDYLAEKNQGVAKAEQLTSQLAPAVRSLDVVIPAEANLNKKINFEVEDDNDAFLFGKKDNSSKGKKKGNKQSNVADVQFKMKRHRGFNMPKERKPFNPEGDNQEGGNRGGNRNRGGNKGGNRQGGNRQGGNRQGGNRNYPKKNQPLKKSAFPALGGSSVPAPTVNTTWNKTQEE